MGERQASKYNERSFIFLLTASGGIGTLNLYVWGGSRNKLSQNTLRGAAFRPGPARVADFPAGLDRADVR